MSGGKIFDWTLATLSGIAGIFSLFLALYDPISGKTRPHLSYVVNPAHTVIADPSRTSRIEVKVNGKTSKSRVVASQVLVYNDGAYAIEPKDFTNDKLRVESVPPVSVIDASPQVPAVRSATTRFRLADNNPIAAGQVFFTFDLLESNDAGIVQVIYEEDPTKGPPPKFVVAGTLKGQREVRRVVAAGASNEERLDQIRAHTTWLIVGAIVAFLLALATLYGVFRRMKKVWVMSGIGFFIVTAVLFAWLVRIINPKLPMAF